MTERRSRRTAKHHKIEGPPLNASVKAQSALSQSILCSYSGSGFVAWYILSEFLVCRATVCSSIGSVRVRASCLFCILGGKPQVVNQHIDHLQDSECCDTLNERHNPIINHHVSMLNHHFRFIFVSHVGPKSVIPLGGDPTFGNADRYWQMCSRQVDENPMELCESRSAFLFSSILNSFDCLLFSTLF